MVDTWIAHPNRFGLDDSRPGHNGHFRVVGEPAADTGHEWDSACMARVGLPEGLAYLGDVGSTAVFSGPDWWFVVGVLRTFAIAYVGADNAPPPPFGFRRGRIYSWWDQTSGNVSRLDGPEAAGHVEAYATMLIPGIISIELTDRR